MAIKSFCDDCGCEVTGDCCENHPDAEIKSVRVDADMTSLSDTISNAFRAAFEQHPQRHTDPGLALTSAREDAAALLPAGVTGAFYDEALTFTADTAEPHTWGPQFADE